MKRRTRYFAVIILIVFVLAVLGVRMKSRAVLYPFYAVIGLGCIVNCLRKQPDEDGGPRYTRTVNPKLGLLGFLGFLGFLGIPGCIWMGEYTFFVFFAFFGFFGFYYEGKMSDLLMDERYQRNSLRAEAAAYRVGFVLVTLGLLTAVLAIRRSEVMLPFLIILMSLTWGFVIFLSQYLLYRYDCEE